MFQSLVLWGTIGTLLTVVGYSITSWEFWCFLGTYWAVEKIARNQGAADGIISYLNMTEAEQQRIRTLVKDLNK
jgi:hypothetical protein